MFFLDESLRQRLHLRIVRALETLLLMAIGALIGVVVAVFEVVFAYGLQFFDDVHENYGNSIWLLTLPFAGLAMTAMFAYLGRKSKEGMSLIFKINQGAESKIPKRTVSLMAISTWMSHLAGASVGKEGVGMQIGATVSHVITRNVPRLKEQKTIFLITGMAAGFAGLFGTPFTAVFFAMEVLVSGLIEFRALAPSITAALCASLVSGLLGLEKEAFAFQLMLPFDFLGMWWKLLLMGFIFGIIGASFARCLRFFHHLLEEKIPNAYKRIAYGSIGLGLALWLCMDGRYGGGGTNLIQAACTGQTIYAWDFAAKFILTVFSLSIGFIGGEVTPLFAIGASLGAILAPLLGLPSIFGAALGYAAVFGAGTNTWLASMIIGMEIFGYQYFPFFFVVCSVAYLFNGGFSIYALQRNLVPAFQKSDYPQSIEAANEQVEEEISRHEKQKLVHKPKASPERLSRFHKSFASASLDRLKTRTHKHSSQAKQDGLEKAEGTSPANPAVPTRNVQLAMPEVEDAKPDLSHPVQQTSAANLVEEAVAINKSVSDDNNS